VRYHYYEDIRLRDFLEGFIKTNNNIKPHKPVDIPHLKPHQIFSTVRGQMIMVKCLFQRLNSALTDNTILLVDVGDAFLSSSITYPKNNFT
jgi:TPP-dependent 2-oxoacid decarboxylase